MKKRTVVLWGALSVLLSACVYLSLPGSCDKKSLTTETEATPEQTTEQQWEEMIEDYFAKREVRDVPPDADFSAFLVGTYAKSIRDFKTASASYAKVLKADEANKEVKENLYLYYVLAGQVDKAAPYAYQALDVKPGDGLPLMVILASHVKAGEYTEALQSLQKVEGNFQSFLNPLLNAWIHAGLKDKEKALSSLNSLQSDSNLKPAYYLHKAMILDYFGDTKAAAEAYGELMKLPESKNVRVLLLLKEFESRTHQLTDKKAFALSYATLQDESFISKEMMVSPSDGERVKTPTQGISWVFFDVSSALGQSNGLDLSLFFSKLALYLNPGSSITQLFMGEILEALELPDQANALYKTVTPNQNIFLSTQMRTVMNLIKMGKADDAIVMLQKMIAAHPNAAIFYMTLGDAYREDEQFAKGFDAYQKAADLAGRKDRSVAPIYFYQGVCLESMGKLSEATIYFEKALALDSENPIYLNYTGYTWLEQNKQVPDALKMIEKAVAMQPEDGNILDSLGWAYYLMGDYEKALPVLEQAVMLQAGNAVLNSHLGDVYWRLGRFREAKFQWSHAQTLKQGNSKKLQAELEEKITNGIN